MTRWILGLLALATALAISAAVVAGSLPPRSDSRDGVTVSVKPRSLTGAVWEFDVALNTHSQDLSDDLAKSAILIAEGGARITATGWQGDPPGGHHRRGVLSFAAPSPMPSAFELRVERPGEPAPRAFRWTLR